MIGTMPLYEEEENYGFLSQPAEDTGRDSCLSEAKNKTALTQILPGWHSDLCF